MKKILFEGTVKKYNEKFGLLKVNTKLSYCILNKYVNNIMNGDRILGELYKNHNKEFIKPIKIIKPYLNTFIGQIKKINNIFFITPYYPSSQEIILCIVKDNQINNLFHGDWFISKLINHTLYNKKPFQAQLIKFIVHKNDPFETCKVVLSYYKIDYLLPKINYSQVHFDSNIYRKDLTNLEFITIDSDDTHDIDDAIFMSRIVNDNINIIIAISDSTAYIPKYSDLDILASDKLFTNYLPSLSIPMLPIELSENKFSLQPNLRRPVLACEVQIDLLGNMSKVNFFLAWIRSREKLTYTNVSNWINNIGLWQPNSIKIVNQIYLLYEIYNRRLLWRKKNTLIFDSKPEYKFIFSNNQHIIDISINYRNIAHKMIEEVMIIANISGANFLSDNLNFGIYNIHIGFNDINAHYVCLILKNYGINVQNIQLNTLSGFFQLYQLLNSLSDQYIVTLIRRYQSCGIMSLTPKIHCGLGFEKYLTWTSPIRKYSDMINHRLLKNVILRKPCIKPDNNIIKKILACKRLYSTAKNNINYWLYLKFFKRNNQLNKIFKAEIIDVLPFGMKALLLSNGAYVFIPVNSIINSKNKIFCNHKHGIVYDNDKKLYCLSDKINVIITEFQLNSRIIIARIY